jgi:tetratricopeptide (TPR) repeat protein
VLKKEVAGALIVLGSLIGSAGLAAEPFAPVRIEVEKKATAREQIALAHQLFRQIDLAPTPQQRHEAIGRVVVHLEYVKTRWPEQKESVMSAIMLQASIFTREGMLPNARQTLEKARTIAPGTTRHGRYLLEIGRVYMELHDWKRAEESLISAVDPEVFRTLDPLGKPDLLGSLALVAGAQGDAAGAARWSEKAAALDHIDDLRAAVFLAAAVRNWLDAGDKGKARETLARLEARFASWDLKPEPRPGHAASKESIRDELRLLRRWVR